MNTTIKNTITNFFLLFIMTLSIFSCGNDDDDSNNSDVNQNEAFVTTWETSGDNETLTIPTRSIEYTYNYSIDWGDGTTDTDVTNDASHSYATAGIYTVSINGIFPAIVMSNNNTSTMQLRSIEQWGTIEWLTMQAAFSGVGDISINAIDNPSLDNVTDMSSMFSSSSFDQDINNWDVSNVTNMRFMFNLSSFDKNISDWDVSNVTDMSDMFGISLFNQDISGWNVTSVTNMSNMFTASEFDQDISSWTVTNVTTMNGMFTGATAFNQDISGWNVINVTDCAAFSLLAPLAPANTPNFTNCTP